MFAVYPTHPVFLEMFCLMIICEEYKFWISTICNFLQFLPTPPLLGLNIPVTAMLPHPTPKPTRRSFPTAKSQVLHKCKTTDTL